jgi:TnpA family transposase
MSIDRRYVDGHGQSEVGFAFCRLLGFQLLPRLKGTHRQKLYVPEAGAAEQYPNLRLILSRPIHWDLIAQQYDQLIKFTTAIRVGTAQTEDILRRFTREKYTAPDVSGVVGSGQGLRDRISMPVTSARWSYGMKLKKP